MKKFFALFVLIALQFVVRANPELQFIHAGTTSVFQPIFSDDTLKSQKIFLLNQQIKIDVFQGYIVVRADYWFNNSSDKNILLLAGLPYCKNAELENCSELYWLRVMINNGAPFAASILANDSLNKISSSGILEGEKYSTWQTWNISFLPGVTEVSLNYGVETWDAKLLTNEDSIADNAFRYSFTNYQWWGSGKQNGEMWMRMNDGYVTKDILGLFPDGKFLAGNSVVHAAMREMMNDSTHEILLWYRNLDHPGIIPSHVSWEKQFYKVNGWKPNEKILATLSSFSATDYEGKAFQHEVQSSSSLLRWSAIIAAVLIIIFLMLFIYANRRMRG